MIRYRRPFTRGYHCYHQLVEITPGFPGRPVAGRAAGTTFVPPVAIPGTPGTPFCGMDPSDPATYTRPWNPQPGMVARLNFDGSQIQGDTEMGGLWGLPASRDRTAGGRPRRRPR